MPATRRKRRTRSTSPKSSDVIAPGGGTQADVSNLASNLGLESKAVHAILNCEGAGLAAVGEKDGSAGKNSTATKGTSAWSDFMQEEGFGDAKKAKVDTTSAVTSSTAAASTSSTGGVSVQPQDPIGTSKKQTEVSTVRSYVLPLIPRTRLSSSTISTEEEDDQRTITPGLLAQTGTLDSTLLGRNKSRALDQVQDLQEPTLLITKTLFKKIPIAFIAASSSSCHSIAISVHGDAYVWGRNEMGQCGNGSVSNCVPIPTKITAIDGPFVGGAVGKGHTILVHENGTCFAVGGNKYGQCGVNTSVESCLNWRKCVVGKGDIIEGDADSEEEVKIVQASCGENFSVLLSSKGHMYSCGLAEFGQLGNGETGEYFVAANKLAFANAKSFERRSTFVQSQSDAAIKDESKKGATIPLPDSKAIRIGSISCGKYHTIAVEAPSEQHLSRVFSWGCGDYGCLGHNAQADDYHPRLISSLTGPIFNSNSPVRASAGGQCSMILTKNGHVYYWGKHKTAGEATMRPSVIEALANNGHVVQCFGGGAQTVFCGTKNGVTVSWGHGNNGELGYGGTQKSSSKPKFVEKLDECLVMEVACGYGHTLFLIRDEDELDKKAWKKLNSVEVDDLAQFVDVMK